MSTGLFAFHFILIWILMWVGIMLMVERNPYVGHFTSWISGFSLKNNYVFSEYNGLKHGQVSSQRLIVFLCLHGNKRGTEAFACASDCQVHYHLMRELVYYCTAPFCPFECIMWPHLSPLWHRKLSPMSRHAPFNSIYLWHLANTKPLISC